jgi:hypothetical protein
MTQYLLTVYQPDGPIPEPEVLERIGRDLEALHHQIKADGSWVFSGGLHSPGSATVVRERAGDVMMTDGPYLEGKEHVGGFLIVNASDLDAALGYAAGAARATGLPIEVRPFQDAPEH